MNAKIILVVLGLLAFQAVRALAQDPITVTATLSDEVALISQLQMGVSHTKPGLLYDPSETEKLVPEAVEEGKRLISEASTYQNTHLMGWELGNPNPKPGVYDWGGIDARMELLGENDIPVITLCAAPDWMKVPDFPFDDPESYLPDSSYTNWDLIEKAPLPEYYDDFAELAATVARQYPQVKHFQVWNEFKGFWSEENNNWDVVEYTKLYNLVYAALKEVNPEIQVGGPYLVIQGTGSAAFERELADGTDTHVPLSEDDREVLEYWLEKKTGADFICVDRGVIDYHDSINEYSWEEKISLMYLWEKVGKEVQALVAASDTPNLPIWWSEYYGDTGQDGGQDLAAAYATIYYYMIRGGAASALLWNPMEGEIPHYLFTKATSPLPEGAKATPHHEVFKAIHEHFSAGTTILTAATSDPAVSVLASPQKTLLINAKQEAVTLQLNGTTYALAALEVRLIDTPLADDDATVTPLADATVRGGAYQDENYGQEGYLSVKDVRADYNRRSFLRFEATSLNKQGSVKLVLTPVSVGGESATNRKVELHALSNQDWPEGKVTWSNQPPVGERLASFTVRTQDIGQPLTIDVTDYVLAAPGATVSFALTQPQGQNALVRFGSRESDTPPLLRGATEAMGNNVMVHAPASAISQPSGIITYPNPVKSVLHVQIASASANSEPKNSGVRARGGRTGANDSTTTDGAHAKGGRTANSVSKVGHVVVSSSPATTEVEVVNLLGEPLLRQPLGTSGEVDVSGLPAGLYVVHIIRQGQLLEQVKMVKQ